MLSKKVFSLFEKYTPTYEAASIDEAYLDMTGTRSIFGAPKEAAAKIRQEIFKTTGLTASIGIAPNRLVAKIASDFCKPDNLYEVEPGKEPEFLAPLPIRALPGCGAKTQEWLQGRGVFSIGELQKFSLATLERHLGQFGEYLHEAAWGRGSIQFHEEAKKPSISREITFDSDIRDEKALKHHLWEMCTELGKQLRDDGLYAKVMKIKLRYPPFETYTRSKTVDSPVQTDTALYEAASRMFDQHWMKGRALRLLGVGCAVGEGVRQWGLFENAQELQAQEQIDRLKDQLRTRFGENAIKTGRDLE